MTPPSTTIRECPVCHEPFEIFNLDFGSFQYPANADLISFCGHNDDLNKCPHCAAMILLKDAEIACISDLNKYSAEIVLLGMNINEFLDSIGVPTFNKT